MINIDDCKKQIEVKRIKRNLFANVYIFATKNEMGLQFAYSDKKEDEFFLYTTTLTDSHLLQEETWNKLLEIATKLKRIYKVRLIVDDVRVVSPEACS